MDKSRLRPTGEVPLPVDRYPGRLAWGLGLLDPSHGAKIPGSSSRPSGCGGPRLARLEPQKGGASHPFRRGWATGKKHMSPRTLLPWAGGSTRRRSRSATGPRISRRCRRWCWNRGGWSGCRRDSEPISTAIYPTDLSQPGDKCSWPWWIRTTINGSKVRCPAVGRRASKRRETSTPHATSTSPLTHYVKLPGPPASGLSSRSCSRVML